MPDHSNYRMRTQTKRRVNKRLAHGGFLGHARGRMRFNENGISNLVKAPESDINEIREESLVFGSPKRARSHEASWRSGLLSSR